MKKALVIGLLLVAATAAQAYQIEWIQSIDDGVDVVMTQGWGPCYGLPYMVHQTFEVGTTREYLGLVVNITNATSDPNQSLHNAAWKDTGLLQAGVCSPMGGDPNLPASHQANMSMILANGATVFDDLTLNDVCDDEVIFTAGATLTAGTRYAMAAGFGGLNSTDDARGAFALGQNRYGGINFAEVAQIADTAPFFGTAPGEGHTGLDVQFGLLYVPEPATMSLLALGGLAVLRRRKR